MVIRILITTLLGIQINALRVNANISIQTATNTLYTQAEKLAQNNSDSALVIFKSIVENSANIQDTIVMKSCMQISNLQHLNQNFADAFEFGGQALRIAENIKDTITIANASVNLGNLYKEFGKEDISKQLIFRSLKLNSQLAKQGKIEQKKLSGAHFNMAMHYRWFSKYDSALAHLDTCEIISNQMNRPEVYSSYHRAEQACIYAEMGKTDTARTILHNIEKLIIQVPNDPKLNLGIKSLATIVYLYLGDTYFEDENYQTAIKYYTQSLDSNKKHKQHNSLITDILEKLSIAKFENRQYKQAFLDLKKSKDLGDAFFGATSQRNSSFLEIKNKYQDEIEKQNIEILKQGKILAEQRRNILIFRLILIVLVAVIIIGLLILRNKFEQRRFKREREDIESRQKAADDALEIKNKELTTFTLKLIEKEEIINSLADKLAEKSKDDQSTQNMLQSIDARSTALWEEFNTRFIEVNSGFYERLQKVFPDLSPTERKHCALIKLNFSGKEMAHLLGITVTSVHVARYRLRKRFGLKKEENLTDFISRV